MSYTEAAASMAARAFFYPSLAWNMARSRLQGNWNWFDEITPNLILGALPFTLEELQATGVQAVVTLNEDFEVFITTDMYQDAGMAHLHIPTVDFLFAPPTEDLHRGVDFIYENTGQGRTTYVHCKAGRGRSTTLVLCYLIKYKDMTPEEAYAFVRLRRPQVCLAQGQWMAVCTFHGSCHPGEDLPPANRPVPPYLPVSATSVSSNSVSAEQTSSEGDERPEQGERASKAVGSDNTAAEGEAHLDASAGNQRDDAEELVLIDDLSPLGLGPDESSVSTTGMTTAAPNAVSSAAALLGACSLSPDHDGSAICDLAVHGSADLESSDLLTPHSNGVPNDKKGSSPDASFPSSLLCGVALAESAAESQKGAAETKTLDLEQNTSSGDAAQASVPQNGVMKHASHNGVTVHASHNGVTGHAMQNGRHRHQEQPRGRSHERKPLGYASPAAEEPNRVPLMEQRSGSVPGRAKALKDDECATLVPERSGSLPGYVRVPRLGTRTRAESAELTQPLQATLAAAGFSEIEDWASVKRPSERSSES